MDNIEQYERDIKNSIKELETNLDTNTNKDTNTNNITDSESPKFKVRYNLIRKNNNPIKEDNNELNSHLIYEYELINTNFNEQVDKLEKILIGEIVTKLENDGNLPYDFNVLDYKDKIKEKVEIDDKFNIKKTLEHLEVTLDYKKDHTENEEAVVNVFLRNIDILEGPNLRCNEIGYYRNSNELLYKETFEYDEDIINKGVVSELKESNGNSIGNRFYRDDYLVSGVSKSVSNSFAILSFNPEKKLDYKILEIENEVDPTKKTEIIQKCEDCINHILETRVRDKLGYEITGNDYLTKGYTNVLKNKLPEQSNIVIGDLFDNQELDNTKGEYVVNPSLFEERLKVYFETNDDGTKTPRNDYKNKIIVIPVSTPGHTTVMLIDCSENKDFKDRIKYFDSSLYNSMESEPFRIYTNTLYDADIIADFLNFGEYHEYIEVLNKNMQINGTCTYWSDCFMKVLVEDQFNNPKKYDTIDKIKTAFQDGTIQMDICVEMSKIFDQLGKETVRYFSNQNEAEQNKENYVTFEIKGNMYGISKKCATNNFLVVANHPVQTIFEFFYKKTPICIINTLGGLEKKEKERLKKELKEQINLQPTFVEKNLILENLKEKLDMGKNILKWLEENVETIDSIEETINFISKSSSNGVYKELFVKLPMLKNLIKGITPYKEESFREELKNEIKELESEFNKRKKELKELIKSPIYTTEHIKFTNIMINPLEREIESVHKKLRDNASKIRYLLNRINDVGDFFIKEAIDFYGPKKVSRHEGLNKSQQLAEYSERIEQISENRRLKMSSRPSKSYKTSGVFKEPTTSLDVRGETDITTEKQQLKQDRLATLTALKSIKTQDDQNIEKSAKKSQSFVEKYNLRRLDNKSNLSFEEREKLKKQNKQVSNVKSLV